MVVDADLWDIVDFLNHFLFSQQQQLLSSSKITADFIATLTCTVSIAGNFLPTETIKAGLNYLAVCAMFCCVCFLSDVAASQDWTGGLLLV
jgi:hypothetical protein